MESNDVRPELERYVNRLSDFFYIMARSEDQVAMNEKVVDMVVDRYKKAMEES